MKIYEKLNNINIVFNNIKVIFFISFILIFISSICSSEETAIKMDNFLLDKIKSLEKLQEDVDLLFAEYCHFNNYEDLRCRENISNDQNEDEDNDTENYENGETYYTVKNANLRSEPKITTNILITVSKGEAVQVYKRSKDEPEWYRVKYNNTFGYMHESLLSKYKPLIESKKEIDTIEEITQSDEEFIEEEIEDCTNNYESNWEKEYGITINDYNQKCSCYWNGLSDVISENDEDYFKKNKKIPESLKKKSDKLWDYCDDKMFKIIDKRDEKEFLKERIKECKNDYDIDLEITWEENSKWCECYWEEFTDLFDDKEAEYLNKNDEFSDSFTKKIKKIDDNCFYKAVGN